MLTNCLAACAHLTVTVSEIEWDICEKIVILSYPLAFDAHVRGVPVGISPPHLVWKNWNGGTIRRWKNWRVTDGRTSCHGIYGVTRYAYASHSKNWLTAGGAPVPNVASGSFFNFPHHCRIVDFRRYLSISRTVIARYFTKLGEMTDAKSMIIHNILVCALWAQTC